LKDEDKQAKNRCEKAPAPANPWIDTKSQHIFHVVIETMATCQ